MSRLKKVASSFEIVDLVWSNRDEMFVAKVKGLGDLDPESLKVQSTISDYVIQKLKNGDTELLTNLQDMVFDGWDKEEIIENIIENTEFEGDVYWLVEEI